jgi:hypothetical protein
VNALELARRPLAARPGFGDHAAASAARRRDSRRLVAACLLCLVGAAALAALLALAAGAAYGGNSDDATLVLQGRAMSAGHLTLSGWDLSFDAFWTTDVPLYALTVAILGVRQEVMYLVPAVVAVLLVLTGAWLALPRREAHRAAARGNRLLAALVATGTVVALLGLPSPVLAYFLLQGGWHATTALCCLIVFGGVARSSSRLGLAVAIVSLAAALLGDLLSAALAVGPLLAAGAVAAGRSRRWRAGARHASAAAGGGALAWLARDAARAVGTYAIGPRSILATPRQMLSNLASLPDRVGGMFGVTDIVGGVAPSPWPLRAAHALVLVLVLAALATSLAGIPRTDAGGRRAAAISPAAGSAHAGLDLRTAPPQDRALEELLAIAVVADVCAYCLFAAASATALSRYLLPGVAFATVLTARHLARLAGRARPRPARCASLAGLVLIACCALDFGCNSLGPPAPQEARPLAAFLAGHGLTSGVGDYWSASIVTVDSAGSVAVRPVQLGPDHTLVRYDKQSSAAWYEPPRAFRFFVSDTARPWQGVTAAAAAQAFGAPARSYAVGTYRVLVWSRPIHLGAAATGSGEPSPAVDAAG